MNGYGLIMLTQYFIIKISTNMIRDAIKRNIFFSDFNGSNLSFVEE